MKTVYIDGKSLTIEQVWEVAVEGAVVALTDEAKERVLKCRSVIQEMVDSGEAIYGVTTGIGEFARIRVSPELGSELQRRIIVSHSAGAGDLLPVEHVRAAMLTRCNVIAKGFSAVRLESLETFISLINKGVTPAVQEKGSVGTSGDLSPMSQIAEVIIGAGRAYYKGELMEGGEAMRRAGIEPVTLSYKEGLGFINGPQMMTGQLALHLYRIERLLKNAMIASGMTLDALVARQAAYDDRVHAARGYPGQRTVAYNLRRLMESSEIIASGSVKVQDGYSIRCTPQVLGPSLDSFFYARQQVEIELNAASDNPLFFADDKVHRAAGNFHGQGIGIAADFLAITVAEVADLSERHTNRLLNPTLSGLPDFLVEGKGLNSGLMVSQYTAAALVSENKVLAHPASVDSISVSADQEDHVSMGPIAIRKLGEIIRNVETVLAIEMMSAAQAMDFRAPLGPGKGNRVAYDAVRKVVPHLVDDRVLYPDIEAIRVLIHDWSLLEKVELAIGELPLRMPGLEGGPSPRVHTTTEPPIKALDKCACGKDTEEMTFQYRDIEVRGSYCPDCKRIYFVERDMGKLVTAVADPKDRGVC